MSLLICETNNGYKMKNIIDKVDTNILKIVTVEFSVKRKQVHLNPIELFSIRDLVIKEVESFSYK